MNRSSDDCFNEGKRIIRVAMIVGKAVNGGTEAFAMNYYKYLDHTKIHWSFFVESTSEIINEQDVSALHGEIVIIPSYKHIFRYISTLIFLFKKGNYDIVHSNMNTLSVFSLFAAYKAGIKVRIAHSHSTSSRNERLRNLLKNLLRPFSKIFATHYVACSELAGRYLFGKKVYENGEVMVVNNAVDVQRFRFNSQVRNDMRVKHHVEDSFVIGHIGRCISQKNQFFLLELFQKISVRRPDAILLLVGDGPLLDQLKDRARVLNIQDRVIFVGIQKKVEDYYNMMDCFALPSLYEGFPVVGIEAQINGLKCFFSDLITKEANITGTIDYIGLDSAEKWADIIARETIADETVRESAYQSLLNSSYDIEHEAKKLSLFYQTVLDKSPRA